MLKNQSFLFQSDIERYSKEVILKPLQPRKLPKDRGVSYSKKSR